MTHHLLALFACLFVVMIGFGITLPVLPLALLSPGMAFIAPNLSALASKRGGEGQSGASLGVQSAASSLGQAAGPVAGGALFIWQIDAPYVVGGVVLLGLAAFVGWKVRARPT